LGPWGKWGGKNGREVRGKGEGGNQNGQERKHREKDPFPNLQDFITWIRLCMTAALSSLRISELISLAYIRSLDAFLVLFLVFHLFVC